MNGRKINQAFGFENQVDCMIGACTMNLGTMDVYAGQNSLVHPAVSTAAQYAVNGVLCAATASSTVFTLEETVIPVGGAAVFVCCLPAAGISAGVGYATNVLTSAQVSTLGATCAVVLASDLIELPTIPVTACPVALYTVVAGDVSHISGSSTFSVITSAGGSHAYTQIMNLNKVA